MQNKQKPEDKAYDFTSHSAVYEEEVGKSHKYYLKIKCEDMLSSLEKHGCRPQITLDLGCGTGEVEEILAGSCGKITGIDASKGMIEKAREKKLGNCTFLQADVLNLLFPDETFDCVFSSCLFHHVPPEKWSDAMSESARVTKKSGILFVFEHNPGNPVTQRTVKNSPVDIGVTLLAPSKMVELFKQANLRIIEKRFLLFLPAFLSPLRPIEKAFGMIPLGGQYFIAGRLKN